MSHKKQHPTPRKKATGKHPRRYPERITITTPKISYTHTNPSGKGLLIMLAIILATAFAYWLAAHP
ncbi:MAG: hypothetical protein MUC87_14355 [Bacteroidia bacterium]|jgi:hypothetical protein|nr:hypothetical protein [Bacteroidia bacterium]